MFCERRFPGYPQQGSIGLAVRWGGALGILASACLGSATLVHAQANQPTGAGVSACVSAGNGPEGCSMQSDTFTGVDQIALMPPPGSGASSGTETIALTAPPHAQASQVVAPGANLAHTSSDVVIGAPPQPAFHTGDTSSSPADSQGTMVELRLSPSDAIKLLSALGGTTTTAPAASDPKAAPASTAALSSLEAIARVPGNTASSTRGAKIGTQVTTSVSCPSGKTVVGGGAKVNTSDGMNTDRAQLSDSYASSDNTWTAVGVVSDANLGRDETLNVTAIALCG